MEMVFAILMLFMFGLGAAVGHRENQPDPKAMRDCQALGYSQIFRLRMTRRR